MLGTRIGHYKVVSLLGEGGMGAVYEAVHEQLRRRVAIKVLHRQHAHSPDVLARFFNEARAVNVINHPGLVQISEFGQCPDGSAYLVMEYLDGVTLSRRLRQLGGRLPEPQVVRLGVQLASALAATHAQGIVHRDLKPGNIMLVSDPAMPGGERLKLLDFGIAKIGAEHSGPTDPDQPRTRTGMMLGTPLYMSPEQCRGAGYVDEKSDVYSLGIILYQMLAGRPPFYADGDGAIIAMQLMEEPPPLHERAEVSPLLAALIHQLLRKNRAERPSMYELHEQLLQLDSPQSGAALPALAPLRPALRDSAANIPTPLTNPSTIRSSTGQQALRGRKRSHLAGAAAVGLLALAGLLVFRYQSSPQEGSHAAVSTPTPTASAPSSRVTDPSQPEPTKPSADSPSAPTPSAPSSRAPGSRQRSITAERSHPSAANELAGAPPETTPHAPRSAVKSAPKSNPCPSDATCSARAQRGLALFSAKSYAPALREFQTAYLAKDEPRLLVHIGLCLSGLGQNKQALQYYQSYLKAAPSGDAELRNRVSGYIAEARAALAK